MVSLRKDIQATMNLESRVLLIVFGRRTVHIGDAVVFFAELLVDSVVLHGGDGMDVGGA
jgi:hypothetical protein